MWSLVVLVVVILLALAAFAAFNKKKGGTGSIGFPYQLKETLFSPAERSFLGVLDQAVGQEYRVFGKVRVADIASIKSGLGNSARQGALNRVAAKHFDFVVCKATDLAVVCAIELNDKSHAGKKAQARDELIAKVCQVIGLPLLTFPAKHAYALQDVRTQFASAVSPAPTALLDA